MVWIGYGVIKDWDCYFVFVRIIRFMKARQGGDMLEERRGGERRRKINR